MTNFFLILENFEIAIIVRLLGYIWNLINIKNFNLKYLQSKISKCMIHLLLVLYTDYEVLPPKHSVCLF